MLLALIALENTKFIQNIIKKLNTKGYYQIQNYELRFSFFIRELYDHFLKDTKFELKRKILSREYFEIDNLLDADKKYPDNKDLALIKEYISLRSYFMDKGIGISKLKDIRAALITFLQTKIPELKTDGELIYNPIIVQIEKINTLNEFIKSTLEKKLDEKNVYYRGQQKVNWENIPSIFRNKNWINHEQDFIHEMMIHNPDEFINCNCTIEQLTKMQHYGVPTRLLDLSKNPLVALYFACENSNPKDSSIGEVVLFQGKPESEKFYDSNSVSILSNIAKLKEFDIKKLKDLTKLEKNYISEFDEKSNLFHKCLFVHVKQDNKRIQNQQGLFLLFGMGKEKTLPADSSDYYYKLENGKKLVYVITNKKQILEQLKSLNINRGFIYPEIDDYATYLKTTIYPDTE